MERWVLARRTIEGDRDALRGVLIHKAPELLQRATEAPVTAPAGDGSVRLRMRGHSAGLTVHTSVRATVGEARRRRSWVAIPLRWEGESAAKFAVPAFEGTLEIEDLSMNTVEVIIAGHYRPPLGPAGALADAVLLGEAAQSTVDWLVSQLAATLRKEVAGDVTVTPRPAGRLTVTDIMSTEPLRFTEDLSLRSAAVLLQRARVSGAPVIDDDGRAIGVLSQRDLLDKAATEPFGLGRSADSARRRYAALTVGEACTRPARTTEADTLVRDAAKLMADADVDRLVVLDGAELVGIVTRSDVLKALVRGDAELTAAIDEILDGMGDPDVETAVENGVVVVAGQVERRTEAAALVQRLEELDGVLEVVADGLVYEVDDVAPPVMPML